MYEKELAVAGEIADRAAEIAMSLFGGSFHIETKPDATPVTEADLRIEAMAREVLSERFPSDAVLGEEQGLAGSGPRTWVLDPIDGTKNFAAGIQVWATLIALVVEGRPVVGLAAAPALGERYQAVRGGGASLNGRAIQVSGVDTLERALVSSSGFKDWVEGDLADAYRDIAVASYRTRSFGDFWGHMLVARGSAEVMLEPSLRTWDWAGVRVIVEEAGGRMTQFDGSPLADRASAVTTNGALHEEVLGRLRPGS